MVNSGCVLREARKQRIQFTEVRLMKILSLLALTLIMVLAVASAQNWTMENYDNSMSRHSPQMIVNKSNVDQL